MMRGLLFCIFIVSFLPSIIGKGFDSKLLVKEKKITGESGDPKVTIRSQSSRENGWIRVVSTITDRQGDGDFEFYHVWVYQEDQMVLYAARNTTGSVVEFYGKANVSSVKIFDKEHGVKEIWLLDKNKNIIEVLFRTANDKPFVLSDSEYLMRVKKRQGEILTIFGEDE